MHPVSISFKGFDYTNVCNTDREKFIKPEFKTLETLGQYYDIKLTSTYADVPEFAAIDISVKPLKENLGFFRKLFRRTAVGTFQADCTKNSPEASMSLAKSVEDVIVNLGKKLHK